MKGITSLIDIKDEETRRVISDIIAFIVQLQNEIKKLEGRRVKTTRKPSGGELALSMYPINTFLIAIES